MPDEQTPQSTNTSPVSPAPLPSVQAPLPQTPAARNESLLEAAAAELDKDESLGSPPEPGQVISPKADKKPSKKLVKIVAVVLLVGLLGLGGFLLFGKKADAPQKTSTTQNTTNTQATQAFKPDTIPYAFREQGTNPYTIYYRSAAGGERKEVKKLATDENVVVSDVRGSIVVFGSESTVYVSDDAGKTFTTLYEVASGEAVNSVKISSEGTKVAIATVPDFANQSKGSVISVDLDGKNKSQLFSDDSAVYLIGWSQKKNQIAYALGCANCDGPRTALKLRDLKANTAKDLVADINVKELPFDIAISSDMNTLVYVQPTYDAAISVDGPPGFYAAAPYRVQVADLVSGKTTTATTIGLKNEKNSNGTDKYRLFSVGFLAGSSTPYFAEGTSLSTISNGKSSKLYEADRTITEVLYASKATVVAQLADDVNTGDFILSAFDIVDKKATQILQGDANTALFGVTTK